MAQTILIAGANRGIGQGMARQATARGDTVIATVRSADSANALDGIAAQVLIADITDEPSLANAAAQVSGTIDLLICNAGVYRGRGDMHAEDMGADAWQSVLMTNVAGPFFLAKAFLPRLTAPGGKIAILSSKMGSSTVASGNGYIYRASKAGASNVAANLATELRPKGIAVGAYHPGHVRTDMGGASAPVGVEDSASGLLARFDALSMETSGVFEDFTGAQIPF